MNLNDLESKLSKYYDKFIQGKYRVGDWIIVDEVKYKKWKNKLKIDFFLMHYKGASHNIYVCETKKEYITIKYSDKFICYTISENEYGLMCENYELLAINVKTYDSLATSGQLPFEKLSKDFSWKLSNKAKEYLNYYK